MDEVKKISLNGVVLSLAGSGGGGGGDIFEIVSEEDNVRPVSVCTDKEELVQAVIAALGVPVFGRVDNEKNIVLSGALAAGTYTVKYENEDGSTTTIGSVGVGA